MIKSIAVAAPIDPLHKVQSFEGVYFETVRTIARENKDLSFSIIDVYTLSPEGNVMATDPVTLETRTRPIQEFHLLHFLELERYLDQDTFREKWAEVYAMLDLLAKFPVKCVNSLESIRYCSDKSYLLDLETAGIPIIRTEVLNADCELEELKNRYWGNPSVVKPIRGECGRYVFLLNEMTSPDFRQLCRQDDYFLLQPFHDGVRRGEISLLFFDEELSHAFYRESCFPKSKKEEQIFPVKTIVRSHVPSAAELAFGRKVYKAFKKELNIYRVDFLQAGSDYVLMEVESVDPYHYAHLNPYYGARIGNFYRKHLS